MCTRTSLVVHVFALRRKVYAIDRDENWYLGIYCYNYDEKKPNKVTLLTEMTNGGRLRTG